MKRFFKRIILPLTTTLLSANLSAALGFNCPSPTEFKLLSGGEIVSTPLCYTDTEAMTIEGSADLGKVNQTLAAHGLKAVDIDGRALIQLSAVDHKSTQIGRYKEIVIGILATSDFNNPGGFKEFLKLVDVPGIGPLSDDVFIFGLQLWVDTEISKKAGEEIWGLPKILGKINLNNSPDRQYFSFFDKEGLALRASYKRPPRHKFFPQFLDTFIVSPTTIKQTQARVYFRAIGQKDKWRPETDCLEFNRSHSWGKWLDEVDFTPTNKIYVPQNQSLLFSPETLD